MCKYLLKQWKNRKLTVILIIIGFFIGSLVMSVGISACVETFEYISDKRSGHQQQQLDIFLSADCGWNQQETEAIVETIGAYGEIQLISMDSEAIDGHNEQFSIIPVLFEQASDWHVPLTEGRYFKTADMDGVDNVIIIGSHIAELYEVSVGDTVFMEGEAFQVIGICGRPARKTGWETAVYMPWAGYKTIYPDCFRGMTALHGITIRLGSGKDDFINDSGAHIADANQKGIFLTYMDVSEVDSSSLDNTITVTVIAAVLTFVTAVLNIVHLMLYWLLERKRELGIMKALGADNHYLAGMVLFEVLLMVVLGTLFAVGAQFAAVKLLPEMMRTETGALRVTWINLAGSIGVAMFFGIIAAIIPVRNVLKLEPLRILNQE